MTAAAFAVGSRAHLRTNKGSAWFALRFPLFARR